MSTTIHNPDLSKWGPFLFVCTGGVPSMVWDAKDGRGSHTVQQRQGGARGIPEPNRTILMAETIISRLDFTPNWFMLTEKPSVSHFTDLNEWVGGWVQQYVCDRTVCVCSRLFCVGGEGGLGGQGRKGLSQTCTNNLLHKTTPYVKSSSICIIPKYQITKTNFKRKRLIFRRNIRFHIRHNILTYRPHTITINKYVSAPSPCKHALPCNQQVFGGWLFGKVLPTSNRPLLLHKKVKGTVQSRSQPSHNYLLIQNLYCL